MKDCTEYCDRCKKEIGIFDNLKSLGVYREGLYDGSSILTHVKSLGEYCKSCRKDLMKRIKLWRDGY